MRKKKNDVDTYNANIELDKKFYGDDEDRDVDAFIEVGDVSSSVIFNEIQNDIRQD